MQIAKVRETADVNAMNELAKKRKIVMKVTLAEENRQREIQRRLQAIRNHVIQLVEKTKINHRLAVVLCFVFSLSSIFILFFRSLGKCLI